jgi:hypothetical protein
MARIDAFLELASKQGCSDIHLAVGVPPMLRPGTSREDHDMPLFRHRDGWALFVEDGGRAALRAVEIGHRSGLQVEVVSGVAPGDRVSILATAQSRLMIVGGEPMDGPRHIWWNFVSSSKERIDQAKADWQQGRFDTVPGDASDLAILVDAASRRIWDINVAAHEYGMSLLVPGAKCSDVTAKLNTFFEEHQVLQYRTFGYGHSFGVLSHYYGREAGLELREDIDTVLEPGMVISMEPMLTIPEGQPGAGGYREHDILIITEDGNEDITKYPYGPDFNIVG